jgi:5-methylcytosine-specific restriction endonuclease McrA
LTTHLERIKDLAAARQGLGMNPSYAELFKFMADLVLGKIDPTQKQSRPSRKTDSSPKQATPQSADAASAQSNSQVKELPSLGAVDSNNRIYLSQSLKRALFTKANYQCTFINPKSGRRCTQTRNLQVDHTQPLALGGSNQFDNLRSLCSTHNQWAAIELFGHQKIMSHALRT